MVAVAPTMMAEAVDATSLTSAEALTFIAIIPCIPWQHTCYPYSMKVSPLALIDH
jgi:hypothetical protein